MWLRAAAAPAVEPVTAKRQLHARRWAAWCRNGAAAALLLAPVVVGAETASRTSIGKGQQGEAQRQLERGQFLVANRSLRDPSFVETVVLLVDYDPDGALGVVVNRPTDVPLTTALPEVDELRERKDTVFLGGPVARDRMVLLLRAAATPPQSVLVFDKVFATGSLSALRHSIGHGESVRAYAGYAGWGPGQLDAEVARGDWLIGPADSKAIFDDPPSAVWSRFIERFSGDWARPSDAAAPRLALYRR